MDLSNKNVLVTGGSRGIGRAIAQAFAEAGAQVAINFRTHEAAARETIEQLTGSGHFAIQADIADPDAAQSLIQAVVGEFGRLDVLVNNAGIFEPHPLDEVSYDEWQRLWSQTMDTNLNAVANLCYLAGRQMIKQGGGHMVNISSRGAFRGEPQHPAYGASKAGLNALSQSLAQALAKYHIYVSVIAPGFVLTDMTKPYLEGKQGEAIRAQSPTGRVADASEIAQAVLLLASGKVNYATGAILDINGASYLRS